jgi:hypothetical protein
VPDLKEHFGIFNALFRWLDFLERNPSFHQYQKYLKTRSTTKPEVLENQKHQSRNPMGKFEGVKVGFFEI